MLKLHSYLILIGETSSRSFCSSSFNKVWSSLSASSLKSSSDCILASSKALSLSNRCLTVRVTTVMCQLMPRLPKKLDCGSLYLTGSHLTEKKFRLMKTERKTSVSYFMAKSRFKKTALSGSISSTLSLPRS